MKLILILFVSSIYKLWSEVGKPLFMSIFQNRHELKLLIFWIIIFWVITLRNTFRPIYQASSLGFHTSISYNSTSSVALKQRVNCSSKFQKNLTEWYAETNTFESFCAQLLVWLAPNYLIKSGLGERNEKAWEKYLEWLLVNSNIQLIDKRSFKKRLKRKKPFCLFNLEFTSVPVLRVCGCLCTWMGTYVSMNEQYKEKSIRKISMDLLRMSSLP